jgi:hypothetical protein
MDYTTFFKNITIDKNDCYRLKLDLAHILNRKSWRNILYGSGQNGKSAFMSILKNYLRDRCVVLRYYDYFKYGAYLPDDVEFIIVTKDVEINDLNIRMLLKYNRYLEKTIIMATNQDLSDQKYVKWTKEKPVLQNLFGSSDKIIWNDFHQNILNLIPFKRSLKSEDIDNELVKRLINSPDKIIQHVSEHFIKI